MRPYVAPSTKRKLSESGLMPDQSQMAMIEQDADYTTSNHNKLLRAAGFPSNDPFAYPIQCIKAPTYEDADYDLGDIPTAQQTFSVLREPQYPPSQGVPQSIQAPLLQDSDYRSMSLPSRRSSKAPTFPITRSPWTTAVSPPHRPPLPDRAYSFPTNSVQPPQPGPVGPMQSAVAPLFRDADHRQPTQPVQSLAAPFLHDANYQSIPPPIDELSSDTNLAQINALRARQKMLVAESKTNAKTGAYRAYDSFSHTYVTRDQPFSPKGSLPVLPTLAVPGELPPSDFWRLLCMDVIDCPIAKKHRRCTAADYPRFEEWLSWVMNPVTKGGDIPQLHWHLTTILQQKRIFRTKEGRIGLASKDIQKGDKICLLAGEAYPYVLRAVEDHAEWWIAKV